MPSSSPDLRQRLVGIWSGKGLHAWATASALLPSSCYRLGLGDSRCLNLAQDQLDFSDGLWDTRSCCSPWSLYTWSEPMMGGKRRPPVVSGIWSPWVCCWAGWGVGLSQEG